MSTDDQYPIIEDIPESDLEPAEDEDGGLWQKTFVRLIENSFEVGKNLQEVLTSAIEPILFLTQASAGIILLQGDDGVSLVEAASQGFLGDHPIVVRKNSSLEKSLQKYLPERVKSREGCFMFANLGVAGAETGVFALYSTDWPKADLDIEVLLELVRFHITNGINRMRTFDIAKRRDQITKASLMQLGKAMGNTLDIKNLIRQITQAAIVIAEADLCDILFLKEGLLEFQVASGFNKILKGFGNVLLKDDPAASIVKNKKPLVIKRIRPKSRFHERPWLNRKQFKSYIGVPIKQDDLVIGVLEAFSRNASKFNNDDLKLLQSLAGPVAASLKNMRLFEETKKKAEELRILHTHISRIVAEKNIDKMMQEIVNAARSAVASLMAAAALFNQETGRFEHRTTNIDPMLGPRVLNKDQTEKFSYNEEAYAEILRTGKPLRLEDIKLHRQNGVKSAGRLPLRGFLGVPLVDQDKKPCGVVMVSLKKDGSLFTESDEEVLATLVNQASIAIQNAKFYKQLEDRAKGLKNLFSISQGINISHDSRKIQRTVVDAMAKFFDAKSACVALYDESDGNLRISEFLTGSDKKPPGKKLVFDKETRSRLFGSKRPVLATSLSRNTKLKIDGEPLGKYFNSFLGMPLFVQNRAIGVLGLSADWTEDKDKLEDKMELLQIFANQVAVTIDNSRLYEDALSMAEDLAATLEFSKMMASEVDLESIFRLIAAATKKMFGIKNGCIFLGDRTGENLELVYRWGMKIRVPKAKNISTDDDDQTVRAFKSKSKIIVDDMDNYDYPGKRHIDVSLKSMVIIPLVVKGKANGVLTLFSKEPYFFNDERLSIIEIFVNQFAIAIRNNQLYAAVAEEKVARREAELSIDLLEEKAKSAIVIERTTEGIFMVDPDFRIQIFNPALEKITGKKAEWAIGRKCYEVFKDIYVDGTPCDRCPMYGKSIKPKGIKANIRPKDGELRFVEINHSLIDPSGNRGVIVSIRDITMDHELEIYHHDLRIATEVQRNILPHEKPDVPGLDIGFICKPAKQIGGDYFDFIPLGKGKLGIAIGDVSGKSLPAALLVSMHKYILRSATANTDSVISPLRSLNQIIWEDTSPEVFVTTIYGVYNSAASTFIYANAGHLPPMLCRNSSSKYLWSPQTPLGIQQNLFIEQQQVKLNKGDILVLLSDGVTDMRNSRGDCFGFERLRRIVKKNVHLGSQDIANLVYEQTINFSTGELVDDFTIVILKCTRDADIVPYKELVVANKPIAVTDARKFVAEAMKETPLTKSEASDVLVAICEAVTNSVLHGQSPDGEDNNIRISCVYENNRFKVMISDTGIGYNPNLSVWRPPDIIRDRGRGIYLMQQLMDDVQFIPGDRGLTVVLSKKTNSERGD